jgi:hypothetical protein
MQPFSEILDFPGILRCQRSAEGIIEITFFERADRSAAALETALQHYVEYLSEQYQLLSPDEVVYMLYTIETTQPFSREAAYRSHMITLTRYLRELERRNPSRPELCIACVLGAEVWSAFFLNLLKPFLRERIRIQFFTSQRLAEAYAWLLARKRETDETQSVHILRPARASSPARDPH